MTTYSTTSAVNTSVVVTASIERAFSVFTAGMGGWRPEVTTCSRPSWPRRSSSPSSAAASATAVFEPFVGGRIGDRGVDGSGCFSARVLAYERPQRVVFSWDISPSWSIETRPAAVQRGRGDVRRRGDRTRVELEHRHIDRHGDGWEGPRDEVGAPNGWSHLLGLYGDYAAA